MPSSSQDKVRDSHAKVSIEEKLSLATEFKVTDQNIFVNWSAPHIKSHLQDKGNENYKSKDYKSAAGKYHRAILYMKVCKIFLKSITSELVQGIDNDLHGTPAFLQNASVDPNHKKHIDPEVDMEIFCPFQQF